MVRGIANKIPGNVMKGAPKQGCEAVTNAYEEEMSFLKSQNLEALQKTSISSQSYALHKTYEDVYPSENSSTIIQDAFPSRHYDPPRGPPMTVLVNNSRKGSTTALSAAMRSVLDQLNVANREEMSQVLSAKVASWLNDCASDHRASTYTSSWTHIQDEEADDASISSGTPSVSFRADYRNRYMSNNLAPSFKMRNGPHFFQPGRIFEILWSEAAGPPIKDGPHTPESGMIIGPYGQRIYTQLRTMVVFQNKKGYCLCFICGTHGGRGTARPGLTQDMIDAHTILYDCLRQPYSLAMEPPFVKKPISARLVDGSTLDPRMRLNFGKIHTVNWNVKVRRVGHVCRKDISLFKAYAKETILRG